MIKKWFTDFWYKYAKVYSEADAQQLVNKALERYYTQLDTHLLERHTNRGLITDVNDTIGFAPVTLTEDGYIDHILMEKLVEAHKNSQNICDPTKTYYFIPAIVDSEGNLRPKPDDEKN